MCLKSPAWTHCAGAGWRWPSFRSQRWRWNPTTRSGWNLPVSRSGTRCTYQVRPRSYTHVYSTSCAWFCQPLHLCARDNWLLIHPHPALLYDGIEGIVYPLDFLMQALPILNYIQLYGQSRMVLVEYTVDMHNILCYNFKEDCTVFRIHGDVIGQSAGFQCSNWFPVNLCLVSGN